MNQPILDEFKGDNAHLCECIKALIVMSDDGSLSTRLGGHTRTLLAASLHRLAGIPDKKPKRRVKIRPLFAWYDLWVGFFWDAPRRRLYVLPLPCIGVVIEFQSPENDERMHHYQRRRTSITGLRL